MDKFKSKFQNDESSDEDLEVEVYKENTINSSFDSASDSENDDFTVPYKKRNTPQTTNDDTESEGDDDNDSYKKDGWQKVTEKDGLSFCFAFKTSPQMVGLQISQSVKRPLDFFKLYFTDVLMDKIVTTTNVYARMKTGDKKLAKKSAFRSWVDVTREEFMAFIGVILNMGTMPLASLSEYWTTRSNSRIPFYSEVFSRDRFLQIFWMLHLQRNTSSKTRLGKVNGFLEYIDSKFAEHFIPGKDLCVGESVVTSKGKIGFVTYNPNTPVKSGIRTYILMDEQTGYVCSILPYCDTLRTEILENPGLPISTEIPLTLIKKVLRNVPHSEGYHLYTDRSFTSVSLAKELLKLKVHLTGVVMSNSKYLPTAVRKSKFSAKSTMAYRKGSVLVLAWKNKRLVILLSSTDAAGAESLTLRTCGGGDKLNLSKPTMAIQYAKKMRVIYRANQSAPTYCFLRKSLQWWRKIFFLGMEMCVVNAYVMHKMTRQKNNERPLTHLNFVKVLVDELIANFRHLVTARVQTSRTFADTRLNNQLHIIRSGTKKDCAVCSDRKTPGKRRETRTYCDTCPRKPGLHIGDCFAKYHTLENYRN